MTLEQVLQALRNADAAGDVEAARQLAQIADRMRRAPRRPGAMAFLNEGIARTLGAPVDLVTAGINATGLAEIRNPVGGSGTFRDMMGLAGVETAADVQPETLGEYALRGAGDAAGALLPVLGVARAAQAVPGVTGAVSGQIGAPFVQAPVRTTASELLAGAGAAVGGELSDRMASAEVAPMIRPFAELAGGALAALAPGAAAQGAVSVATGIPLAGRAIRGVQSAIAPMTEAGARAIAERTAQGLVADPAATAEAIRRPLIADLTPAQASQEPGLLALERAVTDSDPRALAAIETRQGEARATLGADARTMTQGGTVADVRAFYQQRRDQFRESLAAALQRAQARAMEQVRMLDPARPETENSVIVRAEIDRAFADARAQEDALWRQVPRSVPVPTRAAAQALSGFRRDLGQALQQDVPGVAIRLLGEEGTFGPATTAGEMLDLYSELRRQAREAMAGQVPNANRARIANGIADAILQDLGAVSGAMTPAGRAINTARAFSHEVASVFGQGTVGNLTSRQRTGGDQIPPELTLTRTLGLQGAPAYVAETDMLRAAGPAILPPIEDYMRGQLMERATRPGGGFDPQAAETFIRHNRELMNQHPGLLAQIGAAQAGVRQAGRMGGRVDEIVARLDDPRQNVTAAFLAAQNGNEVAAAVFRAQDPVRAAGALRQQAMRDDTGQAINGLRDGFLNYLLGPAWARADGLSVTGSDLSDMLGNGQTRAALARVFDPQQLNRLDQIARELSGLDASRNARAAERIVDREPNTALSFAARVVAANHGAGLGQGNASLQTAHFASRAMQRILQRLQGDRAEQLLRAAVMDRELFAALLAPATSPSAQARAEETLRRWLIGTGAVIAQPDEGRQDTPQAPRGLLGALDGPTGPGLLGMAERPRQPATGLLDMVAP